MGTDDTHKQEYQERLRAMSDKQLIEAFNREVGNSGWTSSRATYLAALHEEFDNRHYDYSDIGNKSSLSFKRRIALIGKKVTVDD